MDDRKLEGLVFTAAWLSLLCGILNLITIMFFTLVMIKGANKF